MLWIWSAVFIGGLLVGVFISYFTKGNSGLADPRTWIVVHLLLAYPLQSVIALTAGVVLTVCSYMAAHSLRTMSREKQLNHHEALLDVAKGVRRALEELNAKPIVTPSSLPATESVQMNKVLASASFWNVPYRRNPIFTGREDILKRLNDKFRMDKAVGLTRPQAIIGLGGIGKTQIAMEYAYRYRNDYRDILWVKTNSRETLISDFTTIAGFLKLPEKDAQDQSLIVDAVKHWLEFHADWLLILDDTDDLTIVQDFLHSGGKGHILLTTRSQAIGFIAQSIEVEKMEQEEGGLFLLRRANIIPLDATLVNVSDTDRARAEEISQALDGLPLALDQAGAYIEETACGLSGYLDRYQKRSITLMNFRGGLIPDHPEPVTTTWSLSFEKVEQANPAAAELLRFCAFLHPDAIPEEIIVEGASDLGLILPLIAADPFKLDTAIKELRKFSLVRRAPEDKILTIHRLVQTVLIDKMDKNLQRQWAERAVRAVNGTFPEIEYATWSQCQRYLPHAQVCAVMIEQWDMAIPEAAQLLNQTGVYLEKRARYAEAEPLLQRALAICEKRLGPEHPDTASSLNSLALLYHKQGKYAEAEPLYQRALTVAEKVLGPEHLGTASNLNNLTSLYDAQGQYTQAEPLLKRALLIREKVLGPNHPDTAQSLNNLAELYRAQGHYAKAEQLYQRALAIREKVLGPDHPNTAISLNNLAELYHEQGKYSQTEQLYQRALAIREKVLGSDHPDTATSLNSLARLYRAQGLYVQAEPLLQRALTIREKVLGPEHPSTAQSLNHLALLYNAQKQFAEAEPLLQRVLAIREKVLGPEHPNTAQSLNHLADLYRVQGRYAQAEPLLQRGLTIRKKVLGLEHPRTAQSLNSLALLYDAQGLYAEAEPLLQRVLAVREKVLGTEHPDTAISFFNLGNLYHTQHQYFRAESFYQRALTILEKILGSEHPDIAAILKKYADLLRKTKRKDEAVIQETRAKAIIAKHTQKDSIQGKSKGT